MEDSIFLKKTLYGDEIRQILLEDIIEGKLKPGERIVETRWARKLGVSQAPVREALKQLESMGLVENVPFQGAFVSNITFKDVRHAYLVRIQLESLGMKDAVKYVKDEDLLAIKESLVAMEAAAKAGDINSYVNEDVKFHQLIMELSPNKFLMKLWKICNIREWTVIGTKWSQFDLQVLGRRHRAIFKALEKRDEKKLISESKRHIEQLIEEHMDFK